MSKKSPARVGNPGPKTLSQVCDSVRARVQDPMSSGRLQKEDPNQVLHWLPLGYNNKQGNVEQSNFSLNHIASYASTFLRPRHLKCQFWQCKVIFQWNMLPTSTWETFILSTWETLILSNNCSIECILMLIAVIWFQASEDLNLLVLTGKFSPTKTSN